MSSNFGCDKHCADEQTTCALTSKGVTVVLDPTKDYVVELPSGNQLKSTDVDPVVFARAQSRWGETKCMNAALTRLHAKYPVYSAKNWERELVEQSMSLRFLIGTETVLEIGACIGRNSHAIASVLANHGGRLVAVEANPVIVKQLRDAQSKTKASFDIVDRPLSKGRMAVSTWRSRSLELHEHVPTGWREVSTTTFADLKKYTGIMSFDTLVLDCEGAFRHILADFPEILDGVTKVLIENDFDTVDDCEWTHARLREHGLVPCWSHGLDKGPSRFAHVKDMFWQCWVIPIA
jgi:FkbM family methyltransferase